MTLFELQLLTSFFVGGGLIVLLIFWAEKLPHHLAGLILGMPSVVAIGLFFLAWTLSPQEVAFIIPSSLVPLGLSAFFPCFYIPVAQKIESFSWHKYWKIALSLTVATILWGCFALPVVLFELNHFWINTLLYGLLVWGSYALLHRQDFPKPPSLVYTWPQKLGRCIFVGSMMVLVVWGGKMLGPFWGGLFTMFPIVGTSSLLIFHYYYSPNALIPALQKYPLGSLSIFVYVIVAMQTFPMIGFVYGTILAFLASFIALFFLSKIARI